MNQQPRVAVIILNWERAGDTIACLKSVASLEYENLDIIICDNNSGDGSYKEISIASECLLPEVNATRSNWAARPFQIERIGAQGKSVGIKDTRTRRLCLLQTGRNGGYAFGNNAGIRAALTEKDLDYVWILNNDTLVEKDALDHLIDRMKSDPAIGICGALVLYLAHRDRVQTLGGGRFFKWRARGEQLGSGTARGDIPPVNEVEAALDYVNGASALVRVNMLNRVGLMDEGFFLYFEEVDWAERAKALGYRLGFSPKAIVYHQVGSATGSDDNALPSTSSIYHAEKSKFRFLRKHHVEVLPIAFLLLARAVLGRLLRGQVSAAMAMFRGGVGFDFKD